MIACAILNDACTAIPRLGRCRGGDKRIAAQYAVKKEGRGLQPDRRLSLRSSKAKSAFDNLEVWLQAQFPKISGKSPLAKAIRYALSRLHKTRPHLDNGFLELDNNTCERVMKSVAIGSKNWMFAASKRGGKTMAITFTLIETAELNRIDELLTRIIQREDDYRGVYGVHRKSFSLINKYWPSGQPSS